MSVIEETRAIVESGERYEGAVIPTRRAEIERPVTVHEGGTVTEGVYGDTVTVESDAVVRGPVLAKQAVELDGGTVAADIGTPGKVTGDGGRAYGTITGTRVRLTDCLVLGNVVAQDLILDGCHVLGVIVGERSLEATDTVCHTFKSYTEGTVRNVDVLLPQAVADGELTIETPVTVGSIRREDATEADDAVHPRMTEADLYVDDGTRYLTLAPRLLDLRKARRQLERVEAFQRDVVVAQSGDPPSDGGEEYDDEWVEETLGLDPDIVDRVRETCREE